MNVKRYKLYLPILMLFLFGCVEEIDHQVLPSEYISFTAGVDYYTTRSADALSRVDGKLGVDEVEWPVYADTKASPTVRLEGDAGIIAYQYAGKWEDNEASCRSWETLTNARFTFDGNLLAGDPVRWAFVPDKIDGEDNNLKVYAYAPYVGMEITSLTGTLSMRYEIETEVGQQVDLIEAEADVSVASAKGKSIPLNFSHVLTAVRFKMGFAASVKSVMISGVYGSGTFTVGYGAVPDTSGPASDYLIEFADGKVCNANDMLTDGELTMMLMPQSLPPEAKVVLTYSDGSVAEYSLAGKVWNPGRMITYTLYNEAQNTRIYFDLAAGNVVIDSDTYSGKVYKGGVVTEVTGSHAGTNTYYVYQSTGEATGFSSGDEQWKYRGAVTGWNQGGTEMTIPDYPAVKSPDASRGTLWTDFITDNTSVESVIEAWDDGMNVRDDGSSAPDEEYVGTAVVRDAGRTHTENYILVTGQGTAGNVVKYNLVIDDVYSVVQRRVGPDQGFRKRNVGGIAYRPSGYTELRVDFVGDNRMGCLHIDNEPTDKIILEGTGSLTVADTDFMTVKETGGYSSDFGDTQGYISNFWNSAIGNNTDDSTGEKVYNLHINSGTIFAGTTKTEDATAIGGGGNGFGQVFISGGTVTAVATTAGTAIGGAWDILPTEGREKCILRVETSMHITMPTYGV